MVALVAVGASSAVTFTVDGLPSYATVDGNTIRATPQRTDSPGDTTVQVTATDGAHSDSGGFVLTLAHIAPAWANGPQLLVRTGGAMFCYLGYTSAPLGPSDAPLLLQGRTILDATASAADGGPVEMLAEFRPVEEKMTGTPTLRSGTDAPLQIALPMIEPDRHYALDVWLRDAQGAESPHVRKSDVFHLDHAPGFSDPMFLIDSKASLDLLVDWRPLIELHGPASLSGPYCDVDGDEAEFLVEVQPVDTEFTGMPSASKTDAAHPDAGHDGSFTLSLPDLEIGAHYHIALWLRDTYGLESGHLVLEDIVRIE